MLRFTSPRELTLQAFQQAYQTLGYEVCQDDTLEEKFQKIAIYTDYDNLPTHVARQLPNGKWTSKLGQDNNLQGLTGQPGYGEVACIIKRLIEELLV